MTLLPGHTTNPALYPYEGPRPAEEQPPVEGVYGVVLGRYVPFEDRERLTDPHEPLKGIERFIASRIKMRLAVRAAAERPAIAMDLGGGIGVTWLKLAAQFRKAVDKGRLILAVTNVEYGPEDYLNGKVGEAMARRSPKLRTLYDAQKGRVQYIRSTFMPGDMPRVYDRQGTEIPLTGAVDVAHEFSSVSAWTRYPRAVIPRIGSLVSSAGVYVVDRQSTQTVVARPGAFEEGRLRVQEIAAAHEQLVAEYGLRRVDAAEEGPMTGVTMNHVMFLGPEAEPVRFG